MKGDSYPTIYFTVIAFFFVKDINVLASCTKGSGAADCRECPPNCIRLSDSRHITNCNETGFCYEGCEVGYFGNSCNLTCSRSCPNNTCYQNNGHCAFRCSDNTCGNFCDENCTTRDINTTTSESNCPEKAYVSVLSAIAVVLFISNSLFIFLWCRSKKRLRAIPRRGDALPMEGVKEITRWIGILLIFVCSTSACEKCYKSNCDKDGNCMTGCVVGYFGKKCSYPCQEGCVGNMCRLDNRARSVCTIGCTPGFYGAQCKAPCLSANVDNKCDRFTGVPPVCNGTLQGPHCLLNCECKGQICDNKGICQDLCLEGFFGKGCKLRCPRECLICSDILNCEVCREGFYGDSCQYTCNSDVNHADMAWYKSMSGCRLSKTQLRESGKTTKTTEIEYACLIILLILFCMHAGYLGNYLLTKWKGRQRTLCRYYRVQIPEEDELKRTN